MSVWKGFDPDLMIDVVIKSFSLYNLIDPLLINMLIIFKMFASSVPVVLSSRIGFCVVFSFNL